MMCLESIFSCLRHCFHGNESSEETEPLLQPDTNNSRLLLQTASQIIDLTRFRMIDRLPNSVKQEIRKSYMEIKFQCEKLDIRWEMPTALEIPEIKYDYQNIVEQAPLKDQLG